MRGFVTNWRESDLPLPRKMVALVRNNVRKAVTLSTCCGHHGEPGC